MLDNGLEAVAAVRAALKMIWVPMKGAVGYSKDVNFADACKLEIP